MLYLKQFLSYYSEMEKIFMEMVFLGDFIRSRRKELGLSQEKLSEGICEKMSISRMERGVQTPAHNTVIAILERLGLPNDRYFTLLSKEEQELAALQREITSYGMRYDAELGGEKEAARQRAFELLKKLEAMTRQNDRITQQYILRTKALIGTPDGAYSIDETLEMLMQAIRLTVPRFNLEHINEFLYSMEEIKVINHIAGVYAENGQHKKAVDISGQLLTYVKDHNQGIIYAGGLIPMVAHNYARELGILGLYSEAVEAAELGLQVSRKCGYHKSVAGLLHTIAESSHFLGNDEKSIDFYYQAYYYYKGIGNESDRALLAEEIHKYLGISV